jgi:hypothetical protein
VQLPKFLKYISVDFETSAVFSVPFSITVQ